MVLYVNIRCGYKISHRGNFKNHLNRKKVLTRYFRRL